jgi:hypothetical protein
MKISSGMNSAVQLCEEAANQQPIFNRHALPVQASNKKNIACVSFDFQSDVLGVAAQFRGIHRLGGGG